MQALGLDRRVRHGRRRDVAFYAPWLTPRLAATETVDRTRSGLGGGETQIMLLSRALADVGLAVCLTVAEVPTISVPASVDGVDIVLRPPYVAGGGWRGKLRELAAVRDAVRRSNARVMVTRGADFSVGLVALSAKLERRRFVFSSASLADFDYEQVLPHRRDQILYRLAVALADVIVVQTEEQIELCEKRFRKTPILIRSLSEPPQPNDRQREAFLWVGRAEPNKQPLIYVELARALPDAHFWMIARPTDTAESKQLWLQVEEAAASLANLELVPPRPRPQLLELMQRAVAVVSTSGFEGMPNIFLEAWANGTPTLALNHDPDGIITRHELGGYADGQLPHLIQLADDHWRNRHTAHERASRYQTYVNAHHSPSTIGTAWADALQLRPAHSVGVP